MNADMIRNAYFAAFDSLGRWGSLDAEVNREVCELLDCDPHELTAALDADDGALRNEIACM